MNKDNHHFEKIIGTYKNENLAAEVEQDTSELTYRVGSCSEKTPEDLLEFEEDGYKNHMDRLLNNDSIVGSVARGILRNKNPDDS